MMSELKHRVVKCYNEAGDYLGCEIVEGGGILYNWFETIDENEANLLAQAYNAGANTYLEACELVPELKEYW